MPSDTETLARLMGSVHSLNHITRGVNFYADDGYIYSVGPQRCQFCDAFEPMCIHKQAADLVLLAWEHGDSDDDYADLRETQRAALGMAIQ
jgi:hypothetical protein